MGKRRKEEPQLKKKQSPMRTKTLVQKVYLLSQKSNSVYQIETGF